MKIRKCDPIEITSLYVQAKKEGIITTPPKSPATFVCADEDGSIVGFARIVYLSEKRARLGNFFVLPDYRRQGIGSALTAYCLALLDEAGKIERVDVYAYHPQMFQKHGFIIVRQYESSYGKTSYMVRKSQTKS